MDACITHTSGKSLFLCFMELSIHIASLNNFQLSLLKTYSRPTESVRVSVSLKP